MKEYVFDHKKYTRPAIAATRLQTSCIVPCIFTVGVKLPTWNLEIMRKSRMMLTANLMLLIASGILGLSKALVAVDTAVSIVPAKTVNDVIRTYVRLTSLISSGTNPLAKDSAAATKMILSIKPSTD